MGRLGKIASLPPDLREEINARLEENEPGPLLLAWLNALPAVQALLTLPPFGDAPINEQNLTNWRQGGFARWQRHRQELEYARLLAEESAGLASVAGQIPLADRLAEHSAMALAAELRAAEALPDGPERARKILGAVRELSLLRRCNQGGQRLRLAIEDRAAEQGKTREQEIRALVKGELQAVGHYALAAIAKTRQEYDLVKYTRGELLAKRQPVPQKLDDFLAEREDFEDRAAKWLEGAESAAWSCTLSRCRLDSSIRRTHADLIASGHQPDPAMDEFVRLPEAERHAALRRNPGLFTATPSAPDSDQGKSS